MNYDTLVSTIKAYAENDFPNTEGSGGLTSTQQIDTFIRQAEQRVFNSVQILDIRKNAVGAVTTSSPYLKVPTDWLATYSLALVDQDNGNTYTYLLEKDVNFLREAIPSPNTTGVPRWYALFNKESFIMAPTPDAAYQAELHYFYYPESIVDCDCSWLGDNFDSVLLYGSLLEAGTFMQAEEDVMARYQQRYGEAMAMLKRQDAYRISQVRYPIQ
jgi:hypothetical protein